jgi:hypothetical protein
MDWILIASIEILLQMFHVPCLDFDLVQCQVHNHRCASVLG